MVKFLSHFVIKIMIEIVELIGQDEKFQIKLFNKNKLTFQVYCKIKFTR